jgi:hypothetical protein
MGSLNINMKGSKIPVIVFCKSITKWLFAIDSQNCLVSPEEVAPTFLDI